MELPDNILYKQLDSQWVSYLQQLVLWKWQYSSLVSNLWTSTSFLVGDAQDKEGLTALLFHLSFLVSNKGHQELQVDIHIAWSF
jgi:hypothetical protein